MVTAAEPQLPLVLPHLCRNIVVLHDIDRFAFLVGSPLIMMFQGVLIFSLCKFKLYRSSPMDIILVCFISELVLNICYFVNASKAFLTQSTIQFTRTKTQCLAPSLSTA